MSALRPDGIALKLVSVALFSAMAACIKGARVEVPAGEAVFVRCAVALVVVLGYAARGRRLAEATSRRNLRAHALRALIGTAAMGLGFGALGLIPLPEVVAISFAAPLLVTLLAALMLGERVRLLRLSAVMTGLVGVCLMVWPRITLLGEAEATQAEALGALMALGSAFGMALAQIHVRRLTRSEPVLAIAFWFQAIAACASVATLPFGWVWPGPETLGLLVAAGLLGGAAQIVVTAAMARSDASLLAPFDYTAMLWGLGIGWSVFAEVPEPMVLAGAGIVMAAGLVVILRERQLRRRALLPRGGGEG